MRSQKQIEANRRNAQKSTGPKSPEGKAKVSRNALKHGLAGHGVVFTDEMAEAIDERQRHWAREYRPDGPAERWRFQRICIEAVRADVALHRSIALRDQLARRASESWDDDRALEAELLGKSLPECPELVLPRLLQTKHGALWLLDRWDDLAADVARAGGSLDDDTAPRLLDLLGVPALEREGNRVVLLDLTRPDPAGPPATGPDADPPAEARSPLPPGLAPRLAAIVADAKLDLRRRLDSYLIDRDEHARTDAMVGLGDESDAIRLHETYEDRILRRLRQAEADLRRLQAGPPPDRPVPARSPLPTPAAPPTLTPPASPPAEPRTTTAALPDATPKAIPPSSSSPSPAAGPTSLASALAGQQLSPPRSTNRRSRRAQKASKRRNPRG